MTRVRAPELRGRGWLNTGGHAYTIKDFRGKIVLLDFWTFCCVNCLHVIDELRPIEEKYADVLVIVGVHSPKFEHERDPAAVAAAVERYGVAHPVLDDPDLITWDQYAAKAWPTLNVVDPEGYVVAAMAGEGHAEGLTRLIDELVELHTSRGTLHRGDGPYSPPPVPPTPLRFPSKAAISPQGTILVSDSAHHSVVELAADDIGSPTASVVRRFGTGERGRADGPRPTFNEPAGLLMLPSAVAQAVGYDVVVADTVNHLLRGLALDTGNVTTVAGTGKPWRSVNVGGPSAGDDARRLDLSSPWDLAWYGDRVIVAMAGIHQLWWFSPSTGQAGVYAGTTVEALRDGDLDQAWLAQPSGLSVSMDGTTLWIADSESSALRFVRAGQLHTAVGQGLFDFGHVDGPADQALFQHPLGVCALADGSVLVADTYNGALRRYDPVTDSVSTVATGLAEPSDALVVDDQVIVVESAGHRLSSVSLDGDANLDGNGGISAPGTRLRTERPPSVLAPGPVRLEVIFSPAPGQKLDESFGPATRLSVSASPPELLVSGEGTSTELGRDLVISSDVDGGVLQVVAQAATCDVDVEHAACHLTRQDWGVPIVLSATGSGRLPLVLRGLDGA